MTDPTHQTPEEVARQFARQWGATGGRKSNSQRSPERRREIGKLGAQARWRNAPCKGCLGSQTIGDEICSTCGGTGRRG